MKPTSTAAVTVLLVCIALQPAHSRVLHQADSTSSSGGSDSSGSYTDTSTQGLDSSGDSSANTGPTDSSANSASSGSGDSSSNTASSGSGSSSTTPLKVLTESSRLYDADSQLTKEQADKLMNDYLPAAINRLTNLLPVSRLSVRYSSCRGTCTTCSSILRTALLALPHLPLLGRLLLVLNTVLVTDVFAPASVMLAH